MRYVTVRVVDSSGKPQHNACVGIYVSQFAASGMKEDSYTDSNGEAEFRLDIDTYAKIGIYVNGNEKVSNSEVRSEFKITIYS